MIFLDLAPRASSTKPPMSRPRTLHCTAMQPLALLARNLRRPFHDLNRRQPRQRHPLARRRRDLDGADRLRASPAVSPAAAPPAGNADCPSSTSPNGLLPSDSTSSSTVFADMPYRASCSCFTWICSTDWPVTCSVLRSAQPSICLAAPPRFPAALVCSSSKSSPNIFTATSALTPEIISLTRCSIGCVNSSFWPGRSWNSFWISLPSSSCVRRLLPLGARLQRDEEIGLLRPHRIGGHLRRAACGSRRARSRREMLEQQPLHPRVVAQRLVQVGARQTQDVDDEGPFRQPRHELGAEAAARSSRAEPAPPTSATSTATPCRMASRSSGAYSQRASRTIHGSFSSIRRGNSRLASTGISVSDSTSEPSRAKITVNAIGRNSLPSTPSRVRIGR